MTKEMAKEMAAKEMRSPGSPDVVIVHEVAAADREAAAGAAAVGLEDGLEPLLPGASPAAQALAASAAWVCLLLAKPVSAEISVRWLALLGRRGTDCGGGQAVRPL